MMWASNTEYKVGDIVWCMNEKFISILEHKSTVFADDVFNYKKLWIGKCWKITNEKL